MTKSEFQDLQKRAAACGTTLKAFLQAEGVAYSTYNYWGNKTKSESTTLPMAPISIRSESRPMADDPSLSSVGVPGVTLAFPNEVRAHFGLSVWRRLRLCIIKEC